MKQPAQLILASASPRRRDLLRRAGLIFQMVPANIEENEAGDGDPAAMTRENALAKARHVAPDHRESLVLGSDTTVAIDGRVLNKPVDMAEARLMLRMLAGRTHRVHTGVALVWRDGGTEEVAAIPAEVTFKPFDEATIDSYFELVNPLDKAGAYGIQEGSELIVEAYTGWHSTIMGLPIEYLEKRLRGLGFSETFRRAGVPQEG